MAPVTGIMNAYCSVSKINRIVTGTFHGTYGDMKATVLPEGFRPGIELRFPVGTIMVDNKYFTGWLYIYTGGNIKVVYFNNNEAPKDVIDRCLIVCSFFFSV